MTRPAWRKDAACVTSDLDFTVEPTERLSADDVHRIRAAAARVCLSCPVRNDCLAEAEAGRNAARVPGSHDNLDFPFGILGGYFYDHSRRPPTDPLGDDEIRQAVEDGLPDNAIAEQFHLTVHIIRGIRRRLGIVRIQGQKPQQREFKHGGSSGAQSHRRRGERPCDICREADLQRKRDKRRAQREAA